MAAVFYTHERQVRSICPLYHVLNTEQECHRFLTGTWNCNGENKIYLLKFQEEMNILECSVVWNQAHPINGMWSSPSFSEKSLLATSSPKMFHVLELSETLLPEPKEFLSLKREIVQALWDLEGLQNDLKIVQSKSVSTLSLDSDKIGTESATYHMEDDQILHAALDPHHSFLCLLSCADAGLQLIDFRTHEMVKIENTYYLHGFDGPLQVDFSPSVSNKILTCGHDGFISTHDFRMNCRSVTLTRNAHLSAHDHTVCRALFNPFHENLILSGSSDQTLKLWDFDDAETPVCIGQLNSFGDTVTDICWSSNGAWVFGGVSYNGKVLIDTVPNEKKLTTLLKDEK